MEDEKTTRVQDIFIKLSSGNTWGLMHKVGMQLEKVNSSAPLKQVTRANKNLYIISIIENSGYVGFKNSFRCIR